MRSSLVNNVSPITIIYALLVICALALLIVYRLVFKGKVNKYGMRVFASVVITDFGYFLLSCAKSLPTVLLGNRITYFGTIFLLVEMLIVINEFCGIKTNKKLISVIMFISLLILMLVLSGGTSIKLYYTSVEINIANNLTTLVKEYGPLHNAYLIYVCFMYFAMIGSIVWSTIKRKIKIGVSPIVLLIIVGENIFIWIIERFVDIQMQLLTVSYVFNEALVLLLYKNLDEFTMFEDEIKHKESVSVQKVVETWSNNYSLTARETEILKLLIQNVARRDIANTLCISEHTVKKHTSHIYEKLCVSSRNDLLYKLNEEMSE